MIQEGEEEAQVSEKYTNVITILQHMQVLLDSRLYIECRHWTQSQVIDWMIRVRCLYTRWSPRCSPKMPALLVWFCCMFSPMKTQRTINLNTSNKRWENCHTPIPWHSAVLKQEYVMTTTKSSIDQSDEGLPPLLSEHVQSVQAGQYWRNHRCVCDDPQVVSVLGQQYVSLYIGLVRYRRQQG